jgi:hypothetical protein
MKIAPRELSPQNEAKFMLHIYDQFGDITDVAIARNAWLSNFMERNRELKKLTYK